MGITETVNHLGGLLLKKQNSWSKSHTRTVRTNLVCFVFILVILFRFCTVWEISGSILAASTMYNGLTVPTLSSICSKNTAIKGSLSRLLDKYHSYIRCAATSTLSNHPTVLSHNFFTFSEFLKRNLAFLISRISLFLFDRLRSWFQANSI